MRNIQYPCCYQFRNKAIKQQIYLRSHIHFFLLSLVINSVRSGQFYSQFYPGEVPAGQEMVEGSVRDERTVVQLQHGQLSFSDRTFGYNGLNFCIRRSET